jgi:fused signal recognition particle receptor
VVFKASFSKLKNSLSATKASLVDKIASVVRGHSQIDDRLLEELEEVLINADLGVDTTQKLMQKVKATAARQKLKEPQSVIAVLREEIETILNRPKINSCPPAASGLRVILVVGINGTGKTTSIGKLAYKFRQEGKRVLVAACDTFRAAAVEQLEIWAHRAGADFLRSQPDSDPAAVAYDAVQAGLARRRQAVIIDTAGRLHTKVNLMEELSKIKRVVAKIDSHFPQEILLVLDSTVGQNALSQVRLFQQAVNPTGLVLTKLDGTAKGGVVIAIADQLGLPVRYLGIGEQLEDLEEFEPSRFSEALFT